MGKNVRLFEEDAFENNGINFESDVEFRIEKFLLKRRLQALSEEKKKEHNRIYLKVIRGFLLEQNFIRIAAGIIFIIGVAWLCSNILPPKRNENVAILKEHQKQTILNKMGVRKINNRELVKEMGSNIHHRIDSIENNDDRLMSCSSYAKNIALIIGVSDIGMRVIETTKRELEKKEFSNEVKFLTVVNNDYIDEIKKSEVTLFFAGHGTDDFENKVVTLKDSNESSNMGNVINLEHPLTELGIDSIVNMTSAANVSFNNYSSFPLKTVPWKWDFETISCNLSSLDNTSYLLCLDTTSQCGYDENNKEVVYVNNTLNKRIEPSKMIYKSFGSKVEILDEIPLKDNHQIFHVNADTFINNLYTKTDKNTYIGFRAGERKGIVNNDIFLEPLSVRYGNGESPHIVSEKGLNQSNSNVYLKLGSNSPSNIKRNTDWILMEMADIKNNSKSSCNYIPLNGDIIIWADNENIEPIGYEVKKDSLTGKNVIIHSKKIDNKYKGKFESSFYTIDGHVSYKFCMLHSLIINNSVKK